MARDEGDRKPRDESSETEAPGRGSRWIAAAAVALVVTVAIVAYAASDKPPSPEGGKAEVGLACESLDRAAGALADDQEADLVASVKDAERAALKSLDQSGLRFGQPEKIALKVASEELALPLKSETLERLRTKLAAADKACEAMTDETG